MWPQWTVLFIMVLGLGLAMGMHGKPREPHNWIISFIAAAINFTLLYFGGFFKGMF